MLSFAAVVTLLYFYSFCLQIFMPEIFSSLPAEQVIYGVMFKTLKTWPDERGFFREIFRCTEDIFSGGRFAQWSHSKMLKGVVKAWHYHHVQYDWWYVPVGQIQAVFYDNRSESPTYRVKLMVLLGDPEVYGSNTHAVCVRIPPGVLHGCKVLSQEAHLFYITSEVYNPADEGRLPYDSQVVDHDWGRDAIVAENDRRLFVPTLERAPLTTC